MFHRSRSRIVVGIIDIRGEGRGGGGVTKDIVVGCVVVVGVGGSTSRCTYCTTIAIVEIMQPRLNMVLDQVESNGGRIAKGGRQGMTDILQVLGPKSLGSILNLLPLLLVVAHSCRRWAL